MALPRRKPTGSTSAAEAQAESVAVEVVKPGGKGRPTPKRREAQARRRNAPHPRDPKQARQAAREERRRKTAEYRQGMLTGDVSKLPARERVPERVLARDLVDARRNLGPLMLGTIVACYALSLAPTLVTRVIAAYGLPLCMVVMMVDAYLVGRQIQRKVRERYPNSAVPVRLYAAQRSIMPARWRRPAAAHGATGFFRNTRSK